MSPAERIWQDIVEHGYERNYAKALITSEIDGLRKLVDRAGFIAEQLCDALCDCRSPGYPVTPGEAHSTFCRSARAWRDLRIISRELAGVDATEETTP